MMSSRKNIIFLVLFILILGLALIDLVLGSVPIPFTESIKVLFGKSEHTNWVYIIHELRLPRAITAILAGAGLAVAGLMMQTVFRNPLAGPYVLGISSGATLGVAIYVMSASALGLSLSWNILHGYGQILSAILGASFVFILVLMVASRVSDAVSLLIVGIMFGSLTTAVVSILQYFSKPELVQKFVIWTLGSLSSTSWSQLLLMVYFIVPGLIISISLIKPMNALLLGENHALATGVNMRRIRYFILFAASLIAGSLTAFTGPIAFIGMAVPHFARLLFKTSDHRFLLPGSMLLGAVIVLSCDIISQVPGRNIVLPLNAITALYGVPIVLWIILSRHKMKTAF